jgi:4'-phosphopantetheinyl transferase
VEELMLHTDNDGTALTNGQMNDGEIHGWVGRLRASTECVSRFYAALSSPEKAKAEGFRFERHRLFYIISHGLLRSILASYLGVSPKDIAFEYGMHGKPSLGTLQAQLHFNMAHSGDYMLCGLCQNCEIGVDLEQIRELPDSELIANRFFTKSECRELLTVRPEFRSKAFFTCWTRKEAFIKATGDGLSLPLNTFEVSIRPGQPATLRILERTKYSLLPWSLVHLEPDEGCVGAMALPRTTYDLKVWKFANAEECLSLLQQR